MYWSESAKPLTRLPLHRGASATWSPPIHPRVSANLKLRTFRKATFSPNFAVELCEAFHCERCFPELHSQQSLMPMLPSTETSSRLNGISNVSHSLPYLIRSLAYMDADFGSTFKYSACPTVPQSASLTAPLTQGSLGGFAASITPLQNGVLLLKVFWFFSSEKNTLVIPVIPVIPVTLAPRRHISSRVLP